MKFVFTADIHLKLWSDIEYTDSGIPKKLIEILCTIKQMCDYAIANDIENIIIGGDVNDTKGTASVSAFVLFKQLLEKYPSLTFHVMHGNHDSVSDSEDRESAVQLLEGPSNVITYLNPKIVEFDQSRLLFIPHCKNMIDNLKEYMHEDNLDILVSHLGLSDAFLSSGISIRTGLRSENLRKFKLVLLGHYHKPQEIISESSKIYYAGSPIAIRRDEAGEIKRFLVVDTNTYDVQSINTEGYRRFHEVLIDEDCDITSIKQKIKEIQDSGDYLVLKKTVANIPVELIGDIGDRIVIDLYEKDITLRGITANMTSEEKMRKYLNIMEIDESLHKQYMEIGIEIINFEEKL